MSPRRRTIRGFTLVEAIVSVGIAAFAAGALLLGLTGSIDATEQAVEQTIAQGIADQLIDEIMGCRFSASGDVEKLVAAAYSDDDRSYLESITDYVGINTSTPRNRWGETLGTGGQPERNPMLAATDDLYADWSTEVNVYYVKESDPSRVSGPADDSDMLAIEVCIYDATDRLLASSRRIVSHIPQ